MSLPKVKFADVPLKCTAVVPVKLTPLIVTTVPEVPLVGVNDEIMGKGGGETTVKFGVGRDVVSAVPPGVVTTMGPWLLAGASTVALI